MGQGRKLLSRLLAEKEAALEEMLAEVERLRQSYLALQAKHDKLQRLYDVVIRQHNAVPQSIRQKES